ncbi:hypothetical protein, partial [Chelativorans xinjiangense]|uniref:hypothetical protein n=1 Tax=Chelativorans xinjiangense TaxID=2681485 RepID=UPI001AEDC771
GFSSPASACSRGGSQDHEIQPIFMIQALRHPCRCEIAPSIRLILIILGVVSGAYAELKALKLSQERLVAGGKPKNIDTRRSLYDRNTG